MVIAALTFVYATHERDVIDEKSAILFKPSDSSPSELNRVRDELAQMDLTREQLAREVDGRMKYLDSLQGGDFYVSIDTQRRTLQLRLGRSIVRECPVEIGQSTTVKSKSGRTWTFLPLKGGFNVVGKEEGYDWVVPEWLYAMRGEPARHQVARNGLGRYVIVLPNNYVIHSPPPPDSPLQGPKPGSFMAPEEDLAAIWPRISTDTRVYIF